MKTIKIQEEAASLLKSSIQFKKGSLEHRIASYQKKLKDFENQYKLSSQEFEKKFNEGSLGDERVWFDWLNTLELYRKCKEALNLLNGIHL